MRRRVRLSDLLERVHTGRGYLSLLLLPRKVKKKKTQNTKRFLVLAWGVNGRRTDGEVSATYQIF